MTISKITTVIYPMMSESYMKSIRSIIIACFSSCGRDWSNPLSDVSPPDMLLVIWYKQNSMASWTHWMFAKDHLLVPDIHVYSYALTLRNSTSTVVSNTICWLYCRMLSHTAKKIHNFRCTFKYIIKKLPKRNSLYERVIESLTHSIH